MAERKLARERKIQSLMKLIEKNPLDKTLKQTNSLSEHENENLTAQADMLDRPCRIQQKASSTSSNEQTDSRTLPSLSQLAGCEYVLPAQSFNDTMTQQTKQPKSGPSVDPEGKGPRAAHAGLSGYTHRRCRNDSGNIRGK